MTITRTFVADALTPVRAYAGLRRAAEGGASFLLESVVGGERWGRYSILGYRPRHEAILFDRGPWEVRGERPAFADALEHAQGDPLAAAAAMIDDAPPTAHLAERIARAHVGFFAWDLVHRIARVPGWGGTAPRPVARLLGRAVVCVFDALDQTVTIAADDEATVEAARRDLQADIRLADIAVPDRTRVPAQVEVSTDDLRYEATVRRAKEYIAAGDAFQIVLSRSFTVPQQGRDPLDVYRAMRLVNPSPYMVFLDLPPVAPGGTRTQVMGASPETLVRLERGPGGATMTVRPIAGTRRRGKTPAEDAAMEAELRADPKERAEHVMLIDLGRNDVGQVADVGSVEVVRHMEVERYSHVMHLVSEVRGHIPAGVPPVEVLRAAFPAGTLSGAPKLRAMQIVRELETRPRGIYGGAVGYLGGDMDLAIAIRTAVCEDGAFTVTAGAGIVEASDPAAEAEETRSKARGVLAAIEAVRR